MLSRVHLFEFLAAVSIFVTASSLASAADPDDACALATSAEVTAAVATSVGAGTYVMPSFKKTCTWTAPNSTNGVKIVTLYIEALPMYAAGKRASATSGVSESSLSGIGDEAYYMGAGNMISLHVKKGNAALKVSVYASAPLEQIKAMEKALAKTAVARL